MPFEFDPRQAIGVLKKKCKNRVVVYPFTHQVTDDRSVSDKNFTLPGTSN